MSASPADGRPEHAGRDRHVALTVNALEPLKAADGWKEMLRRVRESLLKQGVERQEELMLEYVGYPAREEREPMRDWIEDFNEAKLRQGFNNTLVRLWHS